MIRSRIAEAQNTERTGGARSPALNGKLPPPDQRRAPLTEKQRALARGVGQGLSWRTAATKAGFSESSALSYYQEDPRIQAAIRAEQARFEKASDMSRRQVMDGFVEAIEMARIQSDPTAMIKGWTEVAKMCGYYAPETKKIEVSVSAKRLIDKLETMSDADLLRYAEKEAIDVNFVETDPQKALAGPENDENG